MNNLIKLVVLAFVLLVVLFNSVFVISEFERGVKLRFVSWWMPTCALGFT